MTDSAAYRSALLPSPRTTRKPMTLHASLCLPLPTSLRLSAQRTNICHNIASPWPRSFFVTVAVPLQPSRESYVMCNVMQQTRGRRVGYFVPYQDGGEHAESTRIGWGYDAVCGAGARG